jgi:hypothetical protein
MRTSIPVMFVVSILINIGMWFERFVIIVSSLNRDFLPSSWGLFRPTIIDVGHVHRHDRRLLHALPALHALAADGRDGRGQGDDAQADPHRHSDEDEARRTGEDRTKSPPPKGDLVPEGAE